MKDNIYWLAISVMLALFVFNICFTRAVLQAAPRLRTEKNTSKPTKVIVYLGSGGHTGEMLKILETYKNTICESQIAILYSETNSLVRFKKQFSHLKTVKYFAIGKARQVGAGKFKSAISIIETIISIIKILFVNKDFFIFDHRSTLLLLNGPGSCVLLSAIFQIVKFITFKNYCSLRVVYVESLARCNNLSMTGVFIYFLNLSDEFIVQWPELCSTYPFSKYYGFLV